MKFITKILLILLFCSNLYAQSGINYYPINRKQNSSESQGPFTTVSIGLGSVLYFINPILLYEDKKIYMGLTKEISVGFGKFGEHRAAFEYSLVLSGNISHHARVSYKYDILMKDNLLPSHNLQGTSVLSAGGGFFTNFSKQGFFPELTYGYSLRNHKLLIFPHVKLRHTFMFRKDDSDITDISFGIIIGFANPFFDIDIKRDY